MELNPITPADKLVRDNIADTVDWTDRRLKYVTRFRLLTDHGFPMYDVSYCHGQLHDGTFVRVQLPFSQLPKKGWRGELVQYAKRDGVYAKRLGMFDNVSIFC